jgi:hypothetical protein
LGAHDVAARGRDERHGMLGRRQVDPARGEEAAEQIHHPALRAAAQEAERGQLGESEATRALVVDSSQHLRNGHHACALAGARDGGQRHAHDLRRGVAILRPVPRVPVDRGADVTVTAASEELLLVAEVTKDEVVPAGARVHVLQELAKKRPRARRELGWSGRSVHARGDQPAAQPDVRPRAEE